MIKKDNTTLQITLKKSDIENLNKINESLNKRFNFNLTKSQVIQYLINNFETDLKATPTPKIKNVEKPIKTPKLTEKTENLKNIDKDFLYIKLRDLRTKLNTTNNGLSRYLNIPISTLEKYLKGQRNATGENAEKILKAFKENDIK